MRDDWCGSTVPQNKWEVECPFFEMVKNQKILKEH